MKLKVTTDQKGVVIHMKPMKKELRIEGKEIYLRSITIEDTDMVLSWRNSPRVVENFIYRKPISKQEHESWIRNKVDTGLVHQFIICDKKNGQGLGCVYLQNIEEEHKKAEEGIFLGSENVSGRGIGTEAAILLKEYAFHELGLHKLSARVLAYNIASVKMHEKAGYVQESYLKDELWMEGKYQDLIFLGVINPED